MSDRNIQWHPAFIAAMNLELAENRADLIYEKEHNLNTKPLIVDLLIIKKDSNIRTENEIGWIFRKYNILEYKSPDDSLNIDVLYKTEAYAGLYKSYGRTTDERKAGDITVSFIREARPDGLFAYFKEHGIRMENPYRGIYYVPDEVPFPTQIVVTKELNPKSHAWLKALSGRMQKQDMKDLLEKIESMKQKFDRKLADSVLEVSIQANRQIIEELRGDESMCQALLEIMEPEINQRVDQRVNQRINQKVDEIRKIDARNSIISAVKSLREVGADNLKIKELLVKNYSLSLEETEKYL